MGVILKICGFLFITIMCVLCLKIETNKKTEGKRSIDTLNHLRTKRNVKYSKDDAVFCILEQLEDQLDKSGIINKELFGKTLSKECHKGQQNHKHHNLKNKRNAKLIYYNEIYSDVTHKNKIGYINCILEQLENQLDKSGIINKEIFAKHSEKECQSDLKVAANMIAPKMEPYPTESDNDILYIKTRLAEVAQKINAIIKTGKYLQAAFDSQNEEINVGFSLHNDQLIGLRTSNNKLKSELNELKKNGLECCNKTALDIKGVKAELNTIRKINNIPEQNLELFIMQEIAKEMEKISNKNLQLLSVLNGKVNQLENQVQKLNKKFVKQ